MDVFHLFSSIRQSLHDLPVRLGLDVLVVVAGAERAPDERVPRRVVRLQPPDEPEAPRYRREVSLAGLEARLAIATLSVNSIRLDSRVDT